MKYIIQILLISVIVGLGVGYYIKSLDTSLGHLIIGISLAVGVFLLMPLFIYHRWKNKNVKDYMLTKENIEKMRQFSKDNKL
jgi:hypothetical protein